VVKFNIKLECVSLDVMLSRIVWQLVLTGMMCQAKTRLLSRRRSNGNPCMALEKGAFRPETVPQHIISGASSARCALLHLGYILCKSDCRNLSKRVWTGNRLALGTIKKTTSVNHQKHVLSLSTTSRRSECQKPISSLVIMSAITI